MFLLFYHEYIFIQNKLKNTKFDGLYKVIKKCLNKVSIFTIENN